MITGNDIKAYIRYKQDKTMREYAKKFNLSPQNFDTYLKKNFTQKDLAKLADALGLRYVSQMVDESGRVVIGGMCEPLTPDDPTTE